MVSMRENRRTSLLIRCSCEDAQTVHAEALAQRRSVSGYLLFVLERSMWIEDKFLAGVSYPKQAHVPAESNRTAIHLRCTVQEAARIRQAAKGRLLSISNFVVFSLQRNWRAVEKVRNS